MPFVYCTDLKVRFMPTSLLMAYTRKAVASMPARTRMYAHQGNTYLGGGMR